MDYNPRYINEFTVANDCKIQLEVGINYWACDQGFTPKLDSDSEEIFHIGGGGNPIEINCNAPTKVTITVIENYHLMEVKTELVDLSAIDCLYLIGYGNNWAVPSQDNVDSFKTLNRVENGVYEGIVDFPGVAYDSKAVFRFKRDADGQINEGNLGSALFSGNAPVEFNSKGEYECPIVWDGLGNWQLTDWGLAGKVLVRIDLNNLTLHLTNMEINGLDRVNCDESQSIYYNLQGERVDNPVEGIYIKVNEGKAVKVKL